MTRRARRRVEAALVLLAFPVATALTALVITSPAAGSRAATDRDAPHAAASQGVSSRVSVSGGEAMTAYAVADALLASGYDVVAVQPEENSVGRTTEVVYYQRSDRAEAERLQNLLGVGTIRLEQVLYPSSELTILLGKDLQST